MPISETMEARVGAARTRRGTSRQTVGRRRSLLSDLYLPQLIPAMLLVVCGVIVIWSASLTNSDASFPRHLAGIALGLAAGAFVWRFDYRALQNLSRPLLVLDAVLMLSPRIPGLAVSAKGMTGWVRIPLVGLTFQPSEPAKVVTIALMAAVVAEYNGRIDGLRDYVKVCATLLLPFALILVQPDLGTGLVIIVLGAAIIIVGGARRSWVVATIALIVLVAAGVIVESQMDGVPHILQDYQLNRLIVFVDPSVDPTDTGYNLQQAKIAVGAGGLFGKGIGNATQSAGGFLPESHTDFVFALLAEEFGFVGACCVLGLFCWMILSTVRLAMRQEAYFPKLILVGCAAMWTFQVLEEVGMCIGIMPITGIPLPFISFGSTSMVAQLIAVGLVQSVWCHRTGNVASNVS